MISLNVGVFVALRVDAIGKPGPEHLEIGMEPLGGKLRKEIGPKVCRE